MKTILFCSALFPLLLSAELELYPESILNPRVPVVAPDTGGAAGRYMALANIDFVYTLTPHWRGMRSGCAEFFVRDIPARKMRRILVLSEKKTGSSLAVTIPDSAAGNRFLRLEGSDAATSSLKLPLGKWRKVTLKWGNGKASLSGDALPADGIHVSIPAGFAPDTVLVRSPYLDEISLQTPEGEFILDWENGYRARIRTNRAGGKTIRLFGFDTRFVRREEGKRDSPAVCFTNSTRQDSVMQLDLELYREIADSRTRFSIRETVPANSVKMVPIRFPFPPESDIVHLYAKSKDSTLPFATEKHFILLKRRGEKAGPGLFGIHDSNIGSFGWWPDALPIRYAHKYLRWSFVTGPNFTDAKDLPPSLDPSAPAEEWNWNDGVDWLLSAGNEVYLSLQSYPTSNWYRSKEFERGMKKYPHGVRGGGMPDREKYSVFLQAVAERYRGKIRLYELENEPMAYGFRYNPEAYAEVVRTAVPILRKANPEAVIFGICGTSYFLDWMRTVSHLGASGLLDGLSIHTYTSPHTPDQADLDRRIREHRRAFPDGLKKPLFNSETGVNTVNRLHIEKPIPPEIVARNAKAGMKGFSSRENWPGPVADEWTAAASLVQNAALNFLEGAEAFVFFFWDDPKKEWDSSRKTRWTQRHGQFFNLFASTPDFRMTPSRVLLAGAVMTAQMEGAIPEKGICKVSGNTLRGGIFRKANGGKVGILWTKSPQESLILRSRERALEVVDLWGRSRWISPLSQDSKGAVYVLNVGKEPIYVHSRGADLRMEASPLISVRTKPLVGGKSDICLELVNSGSEPWTPEIVVETDSGLSIQRRSGPSAIPPKRHGRIDFSCTAEQDGKPKAVTFRLHLPNGGELVRMATLSSRPVMYAGRVDRNFRIAGPDSMNHLPVFRIHTAKQCRIGRPPEMLSFSDPDVWGGEEELSGEVRLGVSETTLHILVKVRDAHPRLPDRFPGVLGSAVELFLDFRPLSEGFGERSYTPGVYQIMILPNLKDSGAPRWHSARLKPDSRITLQGKRIPDYGYWIGMEIPLELLRNTEGIPERFGADFAINGPFSDRPGRKTQMFGFGKSDSWRNAENFGTVLLQPSHEKQGE